MNWQDRITIEPGKRSGKPCIRGMRLCRYIARGPIAQELLSLTKKGDVIYRFRHPWRNGKQASVGRAARRNRATAAGRPRAGRAPVQDPRAATPGAGRDTVLDVRRGT